MKISLNRRTLTSLLLVVAVGAVSLIAERIFGSFEISFFAFPMNLILLIAWAAIIVELYRRRNTNAIAAYLLSTQATVTAIIVSAIGCIFVGLQSNPSTQSIPFIALVLFVMSVIAMVTLRGWRNQSGIRWRFIASHLGLLLALIAGFWGAVDYKELRAVVGSEQTHEALYINGMTTNLDYTLRLSDFDVSYGQNGVPTEYRAEVEVNNNAIELTVNHPHRVGFGEHIYLMSFEQSQEQTLVILQVVRQPWRVVFVAGIVMMLLGALLMFIGGPKR